MENLNSGGAVAVYISSQRTVSRVLKRFWSEWGRDILLGIALALLLRAGVAEARRIPSESMVPTLLPGDRVMVDKLTPRFTGLKRGDIVVFDPPFKAPDPYIKRIIGLPGESIAVHSGRVWVNGEALRESYLNQSPRYVYGPVTVPEGKLLVLGDNRNQSNDSHFWGFLDIASVKGRAVARFWPPARAGMLK